MEEKNNDSEENREAIGVKYYDNAAKPDWEKVRNKHALLVLSWSNDSALLVNTMSLHDSFITDCRVNCGIYRV